MSDIVYVDDNSFEKEVLESNLLVLVSFGATWCGPCHRQMPILEKYASENSTTLKVCKVDIDDAPLMTSKFGIRSVPTLMLFDKRISIGSKVGLASASELDNFIINKS